MKKPKERKCGNCRWFVPVRNPKTGRIRPSQAGACSYVVVFPLIPMCYPSVASILPHALKAGMWPDSGDRCECFEEKGGKPTKAIQKVEGVLKGVVAPELRRMLLRRDSIASWLLNGEGER